MRLMTLIQTFHYFVDKYPEIFGHVDDYGLRLLRNKDDNHRHVGYVLSAANEAYRFRVETSEDKKAFSVTVRVPKLETAFYQIYVDLPADQLNNRLTIDITGWLKKNGVDVNNSKALLQLIEEEKTTLVDKADKDWVELMNSIESKIAQTYQLIGYSTTPFVIQWKDSKQRTLKDGEGNLLTFNVIDEEEGSYLTMKYIYHVDQSKFIRTLEEEMDFIRESFELWLTERLKAAPQETDKEKDDTADFDFSSFSWNLFQLGLDILNHYQGQNNSPIAWTMETELGDEMAEVGYYQGGEISLTKSMKLVKSALIEKAGEGNLYPYLETWLGTLLCSPVHPTLVESDYILRLISVLGIEEQITMILNRELEKKGYHHRHLSNSAINCIQVERQEEDKTTTMIDIEVGHRLYPDNIVALEVIVNGDYKLTVDVDVLSDKVDKLLQQVAIILNIVDNI